MTETPNIEPLIDFTVPKLKDWSQEWQILPIVDGMDPKTTDWVHRLNSLGSFYYFAKVVLRKHRFTEHLHKAICDSLEKDCLAELLEIPRDHFKSTICSEAFPMWRSLPFTTKDEAYMRSLGYCDEYIGWMYHTHSQDTRNLLVSANITNAAKLGRRIDFHYSNNALFRGLFPEILPEKSDLWSSFSMTQKRSKTSLSAQGEGTYDFLGVGAALQSRHYELIIQDDLVGLDALDSEIVMQGIIDYHKILVGAFDSVMGRADLTGDEIVVGNRWQYEDLNSYLRKFEKRFNISSHSAIGGCCDAHAYGKPIFPEEFSIDRLNLIQQRLGSYFYSCQYLNSPAPPGEEKFKESNLRWFTFDRFLDRPAAEGRAKWNSSGAEYGQPKDQWKVKIVHEVRKGEVIKDILPTHLERTMIVDPSHAGIDGRSRHAIIILGFSNMPVRNYLLEVWAETNDYSALVNKMYELGEKWKIRVPYCESVAFQNFLKYHFETLKKYRKKDGKWTFDRVDVETLKTDRSKDGKEKRIESMSPVYDRGEFWCCKVGCNQFLEEYRKYPYSKYKDVLDTLGYSLQIWKPGRKTQEEVKAWLNKNNSYRESMSADSATGY
jgi:hypothetical protein